MNTIKSFPLHDAFKIAAFTKISMPKDAQILNAKEVRNTASVYAMIDTEQEANEFREFCLLPDGANIASMPTWAIFLDTVLLNNGTLPLHIFETTKPKEDGQQPDTTTEDNTEIAEKGNELFSE
jgi:hypothetical protein